MANYPMTDELLRDLVDRVKELLAETKKLVAKSG